MKMKSLFLASTAACSLEAAALNIVLTNDDGWDAHGIQTMKEVLVARGHHLVMSGSSTGQSGSSAAINFVESLQITKERDFGDEGALELSVAVDATFGGGGAEPVTAGTLGVAVSQQITGVLPDLVISGINEGQNLGAGAQFSGTVGAATAAMATLIGGAQLPAIAISTDEPCDPEEATDPASCEAEIDAQYLRSAEFVADLVDELAEDGHIMPTGFGININYPPLVEVEGAKISKQGITATIGGQAVSLTYGCYADCISVPNGTTVPGGITGISPIEVMERRNADTTNNTAGYITLVPMFGDNTAGSSYKPLTAFRFKKDLARTLRSMGY